MSRYHQWQHQLFISGTLSVENFLPANAIFIFILHTEILCACAFSVQHYVMRWLILHSVWSDVNFVSSCRWCLPPIVVEYLMLFNVIYSLILSLSSSFCSSSISRPPSYYYAYFYLAKTFSIWFTLNFYSQKLCERNKRMKRKATAKSFINEIFFTFNISIYMYLIANGWQLISFRYCNHLV